MPVAIVALHWTINPDLQSAVQSQAGWLQFVEAVLVADVAQYWATAPPMRFRCCGASTRCTTPSSRWTGSQPPLAPRAGACEQELRRAVAAARRRLRNGPHATPP